MLPLQFSRVRCYALAAIILVSSGAAWSRVVYVNKNAPGPVHDGASWATACLTVQAGINAAASGSEVWVAASAPAAPAYVENLTLKNGTPLYGGFSGTESERDARDVRRHPTALAAAVVNGSGVVSSAYPAAVVDGFTIRGGAAGVRMTAGTLTLANCSVSSVGSSYGLVVPTGCTATVPNCVFSRNSFGIAVTGGSVAVTNSELSSNSTAVYIAGATTVTNCSIAGNGYGIRVAGGSATVANSIMAFNGTGVTRSTSYYAVSLTCCDVYGNQTADFAGLPDPSGTSGNIKQDPLLSNPYHNVRLQPGSPCVDAGEDFLAPLGGNDIDGQPRLQGAHVDIGADESDGTTWTFPSRTWYVSPAGDDSASGLSWQAAKRTIGAALATAQGTDQVWVAAGTFREIAVPPAGVAMYGGFAGGETSPAERQRAAAPTIIEGGMYAGNAAIVTKYMGIAVDGFTLTRSLTGVSVSGGTASVANCIVRSNYAGFDVSAGSAKIANCTISANSDQAIGVRSGDATVVNCTVTGNRNAIASMGSVTALGSITVANSVVAFNDLGLHSYNGSLPFTLSHNDVYGNRAFGESTDYSSSVPNQTGINGNISMDPKLALVNRDFHLQPGSPCIDAGDDASVSPGQVDADGQARIIGARVDIGSDESDGTIWTVSPRIWRVSSAGSDDNDGSSWVAAKATVAAALAAAQPNDEVWVAKGRYVGSLWLPPYVALFGGFAGTETARSQRNWAANVTELGRDAQDTSVAVRSDFLGVTLDGFLLQDDNSVSVNWGAMSISNCTFRGGSVGVDVQGLTVSIDNCRFSDNGTAMRVADYTSVTNCTITGSSEYGVRGVRGSGISVRNCIVAFNKAGVSASGSVDSMLVDHCDVFGNTLADYDALTNVTGIRGNISADPLFVDRAGGDFRLQAGSSCIDAGDSAFVAAGDTDLDGAPRVAGVRVDIGAYERASAPVPFTLAEAAAALRIAGGLVSLPVGDAGRLNAVPASPGVDTQDAVAIVRKAAGLDSNP